MQETILLGILTNQIYTVLVNIRGIWSVLSHYCYFSAAS